MNETEDELSQLLDEAVARLSTYRRTFTDEEALAPIWQHHYDISPQSDPQGRFVLAYEADGKHRRQWRLSTQALVNNRLLDALVVGTWNGQDLEAELARLDAEDQVSYIFCPYDPRFSLRSDGVLEPADGERNVVLTPVMQAALDALGATLLAQWHAEGVGPLTVRQLTEKLGGLGWSEAGMQDGWLCVRAWLLGWSQVVRVGQDYWIPADAVPEEPQRARLQVLPVVSSSAQIEASGTEIEVGASDTSASVGYASVATIDTDQVLPGREAVGHPVSWMQPLRTVHILERFLPVPSVARSAYPPRGVGEGDKQVLRGLWFDTDERMWLWLDRAEDRLYGPDLAQKLEWLEAGDVVRVGWRSEVIVLRCAGHDDEIQREEMRLVDLEELKALRGGLGETYRQSIQAILAETPEGLTFAEVVEALRGRQGHDVHRGTVRTLLYAAGFVHRNGCWFAAPESSVAAYTLRTALVETLVSKEEHAQVAEPTARLEQQRGRVRAIGARLAELVRMLKTIE